jgi:hypothetical protein
MRTLVWFCFHMFWYQRLGQSKRNFFTSTCLDLSRLVSKTGKTQFLAFRITNHNGHRLHMNVIIFSWTAAECLQFAQKIHSTRNVWTFGTNWTISFCINHSQLGISCLDKEIGNFPLQQVSACLKTFQKYNLWLSGSLLINRF